MITRYARTKIISMKKESSTIRIGFFWLLLAVSIFIFTFLPGLSFAETVYVKYRGPVDLSPFKCSWIFRSSFVNRLCYDSREQYVIVKLKDTYYHYCEVPSDVVRAWMDADSMGRFYNSFVKGRFDCRKHYIPPYDR